MPKPKKSHKPRHGHGAFYYDANRNVWRGVIEAGYDDNGKRRRYTVSSRDEDTAWRKYKAKANDVEAGKASIDGREKKTVKEWLTEWLADRETQVRPKTFATESGQLTKWVIPSYGRVQLRDLTGEHIRKLARRMRDAGVSTTTIAYTQRVWQQAMKDAQRDGYLVSEAFLLAKRAKKAVSDRTAIPLPDAIKLLHEASRAPDASRWVAALLQGMRQGECLGLTWDMVDFDRDEIDVSWQLQALPYKDKARDVFRVPDGYEARHMYRSYHLTRPKTAKGQRIIPLVPWMKLALLEWREVAPDSPHGLVWVREDGGLRTPRCDLDEWKALQDRAKVSKNGEHYVLHEARNTTATLLMQAGVDPLVIQQILGHSSFATSQAYMRVNKAQLRDALEKVAHELRLEA